MIGPGSGNKNGGGIATYIDNIIPFLHQEYNIIRVVTVAEPNIIYRFYNLIQSVSKIIIIAVYNYSKPKIAHIHMASRWSFARKRVLINILYYLKIPIILHLHGAEFDIFFEKESSKAYRKKIIQTFGLCDQIITLSLSWENWLKSNIPHGNLKLVYNCSDDYLDNDLAKKRKNNVLLYMGRIGKRKGVFDLLDALSEIEKEGYDFKMLIAGDGDLKKAIARSIDLQIDKKVNFLGWVGTEKKRELLNLSTCYILPSYSEGMPIGILEALSAALPIIATNIDGIVETIDHNKNGFMFNPGDKDRLKFFIKNILDDKTRAKEMGNNSRIKFIDKFRMETISKSIKSSYQEALRNAG
jgi:glycosyltransferase involved in cell wall biosynthesis